MTAPKRGCYCHMLRSDEGLCHVCELWWEWEAKHPWQPPRIPPAPTAAQERLIAVDLAVRAAIQTCFPQTFKSWGSEGNTLVAIGYDNTSSWVGQSLRHEVANQFRKLTEKPCIPL